MATVGEQIKQNPLITLLVLVAAGILGFMFYSLFAGVGGVGISGILLTIVVLFGLGVLLFILRGAGEKSVQAEDFIFIVMAAAGVFGLAFLILKFNVGSFAIYDAPLNEVSTFVGGVTNLWVIFGITAIIFLFGTKRGKAARMRYLKF